MTMRLSSFACILCQFVSGSLANTEKVIFLAPNALPVSSIPASFCPPLLAPTQPILHAELPVIALSGRQPDEQTTQRWYLLGQLREGQRYEVRVCWSASQPTEFWLDTFTLPRVLERPELVSDLARHSNKRQETACHQSEILRTSQSLLFLRVRAAADFHSTNYTLMHHPPAVWVDIILDPYLLNILPRSLIPHLGLTSIAAICALPLSGMTWRLLRDFANARRSKYHTDITGYLEDRQPTCILVEDMVNTARSSRFEQHVWDFVFHRSMASQPTILALPLDLQLLILDRLPWNDYVAFALAGYHDLQYRHADRFPSITQRRMKLIGSRSVPGNDLLWRLPNEMIENIARYVDRKSLMSWVFAHYPTLVVRQLVPALTLENAGQLYISWLRSN